MADLFDQFGVTPAPTKNTNNAAPDLFDLLGVEAETPAATPASTIQPDAEGYFSRNTPAKPADTGVGRIRSAIGSIAQGAGEIFTSIPKSASVAQTSQALKLLSALDAVDRGENADYEKSDPFDLGGVAVDIYKKSSPEKRAEMRANVEKNAKTNPKDRLGYQLGDAIDENLAKIAKTNPEYEQEWISGKIPRALGSMFGFVLANIAGRGAGAKLAPKSGGTISATSAGVATTAAVGASAATVEGFEDALKHDASIEDAVSSGKWNALWGMSEIVPISRILDRVDKGTGGSVKRLLINMAKGGTEELAQESFQNIMHNVTASGIVKYDPERQWWEGTGEAAGVGFSTGALMEFLLTVASGGRRGVKTTDKGGDDKGGDKTKTSDNFSADDVLGKVEQQRASNAAPTQESTSNVPAAAASTNNATQNTSINVEPFDPRLKRADYRDAIARIVQSDLVEGGGIAVIPDAKHQPGESDKRGESRMIRTKSLNQPWVQEILRDTGLSVSEVKQSVDIAVRGGKLGERQKRAVIGILDNISENRDADVPFAKEERLRARELRKATRTGLPPSFIYDEAADEYAGEVYEEESYDAGWDGETRALYELAQEARELDEDGAIALLEQSGDASNSDAARALWKFIAEKKKHVETKPGSERVGEAQAGEGKREQAQETKPRGEKQAGEEKQPVVETTSTVVKKSTVEEKPKEPVQESKSFTKAEQQLRGEQKKSDRPSGETAAGPADKPAQAPASDSIAGQTPSKEGVSLSATTKELPKSAKLAEAPSSASDLSDVDAAAHEAATSDKNDLPQPSEEQKKAGNYKKGHAEISGLDLSIENPEGSKRRPEWPALKSHYGYVARVDSKTAPRGKDKDHIDVFVKPGTATDYSGPVFIIDQTNKDGAFDEHKVMIGWANEASARQGYLDNYAPGWNGLGAIKQLTFNEFKLWLKSGDTTKPAALNDKPAYGKSNKLVTADRADYIRAKLKAKLRQLNVGIDPEVIALGTELAVYHVEAGARKFKDFSQAMIADLGEKIRPYLRSLYLAARNWPGIDRKEMNTEAELDLMNDGESTSEKKEAASENKDEAKQEQKPTEKAEDTSAQDDSKSADIVKAAGLNIRQSRTANGNDVWEVTGNTLKHKDMLKELGGRWYGPKKAWSFYNTDPTAKIAARMGGKAETEQSAQAAQTDIPVADTAAIPQQRAVTDYDDLINLFYDRIKNGNEPQDNNALKKLVAEFDGEEPSQLRMKGAQEDFEAAAVMRARDIIVEGEKVYRRTNSRKQADEWIFNQLKALYMRMPNLSIRTSTSVANQAYSTPAPIAFLASRLANIDQTRTVYEPTAGNGMLLIGAATNKITANEIDPRRVANLRQIYNGALIIEGDAVTAIDEDRVAQRVMDAVIANPPFGGTEEVRVDGYKVNKLDHLIAAKALETMRDTGRATLIIGANRTPGDITTAEQIFFNWLYSKYNVIGHFEVDGKLYARQGAGWPIRIITIAGRADSAKKSPVSGEIERVNDWGELYAKYEHTLAAAREAVVSKDSAEQQESRARGQDSAEQGQSDAAGTRGADGAENQSSGARGRAGSGVSDTRGRVGDGGRAGRDGESRTDGRADGVGQDGSSARNDRLDQGGQANDRGVVADGADVQGDGLGRADRGAVEGKSNQFQVPYRSRSSSPSDGALVPVNMDGAIQKALDKIVEEVGDLDAYVMDKLGYKSKDDLFDAFMGLQIDSVAAAIYNIEKGQGVIIADQTGIGKGRQAAAIIRYAVRQGKVPVFVTAKPDLFTDMYNDLLDIGSKDVKPLILNKDESITDRHGKSIFANEKGRHAAVLRQMAESGELPNGRNVLFMTYSQINKDNPQRAAVGAVAPGAIFILDESHNAGGSSNTGEFIRGVLSPAQGVVYLSATYAKRPDNMPVYFRTALSTAVDSIDQLVDAMDAGGLPLQTVVSNLLTETGQLFRRERDFDGVEIRTEVDVPNRAKHEEVSDKATEALRAIVRADKLFHQHAKDLDKKLRREGRAASGAGNNASKKGLDHTEFSAVVHNFVRQMILALKVDTAADKAITALKADKKPVIALENTMGSFLGEYVKENNLKEGDELSGYDFRAVLNRALRRTRRVKIRDEFGNDSIREIKLEELPASVWEAYNEAQEIIDNLELDLPASPIDWIRNKVEKAGYFIKEITGREWKVDYSGAVPKLARIGSAEADDRWNTRDEFNSGKLDALILNVAGSTGISLHASEKFLDQKRRHMIVAQPMLDINIFVQMLGRVHRTGQVIPPEYTILNVDLPAEKRPTAVLAGKMKKLNANVSSNTESATSINVPDILNKYGDQVVSDYLIETGLDSELNVATGDDNLGVARKATGRMALMPIDAQRDFYEHVEAEYKSLIEYLDKIGQNDLEPKTLDLDAKKISEEIIVPGKDTSNPFGNDAVLGKYDVRRLGKPPTPEDVQNAIKERLQGKSAREITREMLAEKERKGEIHRKALLDAIDAIEKMKEKNHSAESMLGGLRKRLGDYEASRAKFQTNARDVIEIGSAVRLDINGESVVGVVVDIKDKAKEGPRSNPYASSKTLLTFMVNNGIRQITIPMSKLFGDSGVYTGRYFGRIDQAFDPRHIGNAREQRQIITGNLLSAFAELRGVSAQIVNFTNGDGSVTQGIMLPKNFNKDAQLAGELTMRSASGIVQYLSANWNNNDVSRFGVGARDATVRIVPGRGGAVKIRTPKAKASGGRWYLDQGLLKHTGDFASVGNMMEAEVSGANAEAAVQYIMSKTALYAPKSLANLAKPYSGEADRGEAVLLRANTVPASDQLSAREITEVTEELLGQFAEKPEVVVIDSAADAGLPQGVEAAGFVKNGRIYLVRAGLGSRTEVVKTFWHELLHYGLRRLLTKDQYIKVMRDLALRDEWLGNKAREWARTDEVAQQLKEKGESGEYIHARGVDEALAELAESNQGDFANDGMLARLIRAVSRWIAQWAERFGFHEAAAKWRGVTNDEARALIKYIFAKLREDGPGPGRMMDDEAAFSLANSASTMTSGEGILDIIREGRPIEAVFRGIFKLAQIDKGTKWAIEQIENGLTQAKFKGVDKDSFLGQVNGLLETARAGLIDRYGLSEEYKDLDTERGAHERRIALKGAEIVTKLMESGMNAAEAEVLHGVLTGEAMPDEKWQKLSDPVRKAIDELGHEAVELGLISKDTYEKNRATYLHRVYKKHEDEHSGLTVMVRNIMSSRRKRIIGNTLKKRGMEIKVDPTKLLETHPEWFGKKDEIGKADKAFVGSKFHMLHRVSNVGQGVDNLQGIGPGGQKPRVLERVFVPADRPIPAKYQSYEHMGTWEVRDTHGGQYVLWRDFTKDEREKMGEIIDARYTIAKTFHAMAHDLSTGRFLADIAKNDEWTYAGKGEPPGNVYDGGNSNRFKVFTGYDWVRVPDTTIPGTGRKRWGALAGRYVRAEIWRDLNQLHELNKPRFWNTMLTQWKLNKTARNPVVHMNNIMSNLVLMDMADIRMRDLYRAIVAMKDKTQEYKDAQEHGAFGSNFVLHEIKQNVLDPILQEIMNQSRAEKGWSENIAEHYLGTQAAGLGRILDAIVKGTTKLDRGMLNIYQLEDEIFRMATYMRRLSLGDSPKHAARVAREQFIDYDIRAPWVNAARSTVLPFVAYTYRAVPLLAKTIAERPWKLAKYATIAYMVNALGYAFEPGDEDEERKSLREEQQGMTWLGSPRMIRMGWRDAHGNPIFLDVRRYIPAGDIFDIGQSQSVLPVPAPFIFGGPIMLAAELAMNRSSFTGKDIVNQTTADAGDIAKGVAAHLWRSWMPSAPWIYESWYWEKIERAYSGVRDARGNVYELEYAVASSFGVKLTPQDVKIGRRNWALELGHVMRELESEARQLSRDYHRGLITKETFDEQLAAIRKKMANLKTKADEVFKKQ